jgi:hypothetical protein
MTTNILYQSEHGPNRRVHHWSGQKDTIIYDFFPKNDMMLPCPVFGTGFFAVPVDVDD